jgi:DNA polymerase-3 subunit beta
MKIKTDKDLLLAKLTKIISFVPKKPIIPVMDCFKVKANPATGITLWATDGNNQVSCSVGCTIKKDEEEIQFFVPAKLFTETVKNFRDIDITIDVNETQNGVSIELKSGKSKYKITGFKGSDMDMMPGIEESTSYTCSMWGLPFKKLLSTANKVADDKNVNHNLQGIEISMKDNAINLVSGCGFYILKSSIKPKSLQDWTTINLTNDFSSKLTSLIGDDDEVVLSTNGDKIMAITDGYTVTGVLHNGKFPSVEAIWKKKDPIKSKLKLNTAEFSSCVDRISLYVNQESSTLVMDFKENEIIITGHDVERGVSGEESISCEHSMTSGAVAFNATFFDMIFSLIESNDFVFHINEEQKMPSFVTPAEQTRGMEYEFCVMPIAI